MVAIVDDDESVRSVLQGLISSSESVLAEFGADCGEVVGVNEAGDGVGIESGDAATLDIAVVCGTSAVGTEPAGSPAWHRGSAFQLAVRRKFRLLGQEHVNEARALMAVAVVISVASRRKSVIAPMVYYHRPQEGTRGHVLLFSCASSLRLLPDFNHNCRFIIEGRNAF